MQQLFGSVEWATPAGAVPFIDFLRPIQVLLLLILLLSVCVCYRSRLRRCLCWERSPLRRVDSGDKYAVKIPEGPSAEFGDDTDFMGLATSLDDAAGAAAAADGKAGNSIYEELNDPNNLSDYSAESADFESIFDNSTKRKPGGATVGAKGKSRNTGCGSSHHCPSREEAP